MIRHSSAPASPSDSQAEIDRIKRTLRLYKRIGLALAGVAAISVLAWASIAGYHHFVGGQAQPHSPVPLSIRRNANFSIYYPDQAKLPAGYTLNTGSFKFADNTAVIYTVSYGANKKLTFSVQKKPADTIIQKFATGYIPLHTNVTTPTGTALVGAIGMQTVVSLPTKGNAWIIITGPSDTDQTRLTQVLRSIKSPGSN
jgi:hypothetical protein